MAPISGLAGIGAGGVALTESVLLSGGAVLAVIGGSVGIAAYRSYPKPLTDPETLVGHTFAPPSSIPPLSEDVPLIGVFGETQSGKSTLIRKLQMDTDPPKPTRGLYVTVLRTNGANPRVFLLLDGEGENPAEQSKICVGADLLFFVVDHDISESEVRISKDRRKDHQKFWSNMAPFFKDRDQPIDRIHVLLNKKDKWSESSNSYDFEIWGEELCEAIKANILCSKVTVDPHSNFNSDDIITVWEKIEEFVQ